MTRRAGSTELEVVLRAEQALLGGLLAGGDPGRVRGIRAGDFSDPRHQAIYLALTGAASEAGGARGLRGGRRRVREAVAYLNQLVLACPSPGHLGSYAAMVARAGARQAADGAAGTGPAGDNGDGGRPGSADAQLASADSWLSVNGGRARRGRRTAAGAGDPGGGDGDPLRDPAVTELARALRPVVAARVQARREALAGHEEPGPAAAAARAEAERGARAGQASPGAGAAGGDHAAGAEEGPGDDASGAAGGDREESAEQWIGRESLQRLVLADLMRRPQDGRGVAARVPAAMFTAGPARQLYGLIRERIVSGEAVDPLIIAWEARERYGAEPVPGGPLEWSLGEIALLIGAAPTAAGTARVYGRALLADHVLSSRFGDGWTREADFAGRLYLAPADDEPAVGRAVAAGEGRAAGAPAPGNGAVPRR